MLLHISCKITLIYFWKSGGFDMRESKININNSRNLFKERQFKHLCKFDRYIKQKRNHPQQNVNDFKIQVARNIRIDVLSLYRKMSSLVALDI